MGFSKQAIMDPSPDPVLWQITEKSWINVVEKHRSNGRKKARVIIYLTHSGSIPSARRSYSSASDKEAEVYLSDKLPTCMNGKGKEAMKRRGSISRERKNGSFDGNKGQCVFPGYQRSERRRRASLCVCMCELVFSCFASAKRRPLTSSFTSWRGVLT